MKTIDTLIPDIYELVERKDGWSDQIADDLGAEISHRLRTQFSNPRQTPRLRLSQMGPRCPCALWHSIRKPEEAEALPPWAEIKYSFGHTLEAFAIALAKAAGHSVVGEQDELIVDGISGHRDCVIDGCVVDVKSASSRAFIKFKDRSLREKDDFGYLEQLDAYLCGSQSDPLVTVKDKGYLWAIDKQLGHMVLYEHAYREDHIRKRVRDYKVIVALDRAPRCTCKTVPHGKSGNIALGVNASYSQYKFSCFPQLRCFLYSDGPVYLTHIERKPDVPEIDRLGNII